MAIELRKYGGMLDVRGKRIANWAEPSVTEVIEWLEQQGVGFRLALCRFSGGEWVFHAVDEPADGEATHFAIALGGDE